jgi:hypothetical protein
MKRVELIKTIEGFGCVLIRPEQSTIDIATPTRASHSQFRVIERSRKTLRDISFECFATIKSNATTEENKAK